MDADIQRSTDKFIELITRMRQIAPEKAPPQAAGLSPSLMSIIDFVGAFPHCGVKEIARGLKLSASSVSVSVRHLEEAGYIHRRPHPTDKRAVQFFLTPQGRKLRDQTQAFRRRKFEKLLSGLTPDEWGTLIFLLEKVLNQAERNITHTSK